MFTGLIEETGIIKKITGKSQDREIEIRCSKVLKDLAAGDSISVNGVCLTAKSSGRESFICDIAFSTLNTTALKHYNPGDEVNLESSLTPTDKLGGHLISGHVDCVSKILKISGIGKSHLMNLELLPEIREFVAPKGSIAIDGISFTVYQVENDNFSVAVIPYTFKNTNLHNRIPQDIVNIETDMISRYTVNYLRCREMSDTNIKELKDRMLEEKLEKYGFKKQEK